MQRNCDTCGKPYAAQRSTSKYCSSTCRVYGSRGARAVDLPVAPVVPIEPPIDDAAADVVPEGVASATRRALLEAERYDTPIGQAAYAIARRMDSSAETGSAIAALSKELRVVMEAALAGTNQAADPLDELRRRRDEKRAQSAG